MKAYSGKGAPASYTMVNDVEFPLLEGDVEITLTCMAKHRPIEQHADKTWTVGDWSDGPTWTADLNRLNDEIRDEVFGYGIRKVLEDRASQIDVGPEKLAHYHRTFERLAEGHWKSERQAQYRIDSILVEALLELKPGVARPAIEAQLKADKVVSEEFLAAYPRVLPIYTRLKKSAKTVTAVDFSALLDDDEDHTED